ncbi:chorion class B protein PC10-like [Vanessa atalanta]|uniref:chorion class B protein PC10-like n=1 Tax=Vanessa atalanta TaxID=42275 RepID=UPI001FCD9BFD|nr:chorion class B protein PC10-like [Vanessa atalanta]
MAAKSFLLFCAQALLIKCIYSQCIGVPYNPIAAEGFAWGTPNSLAWEAANGPWGAPCAAATWATAPIATTPYATAEWAGGFGPATLAASNGGGLAVTSASPIAPSGVAMTSDNAYEGALAVSGAVPFLGAVAMEGALPTAGAGTINYSCGNGNVAMITEDVTPAGYNAFPGPYGYGPIAAAELGYGYGPLAFEAGINGAYGYRGCGAVY